MTAGSFLRMCLSCSITFMVASGEKCLLLVRWRTRTDANTSQTYRYLYDKFFVISLHKVIVDSKL